MRRLERRTWPKDPVIHIFYTYTHHIGHAHTNSYYPCATLAMHSSLMHYIAYCKVMCSHGLKLHGYLHDVRTRGEEMFIRRRPAYFVDRAH